MKLSARSVLWLLPLMLTACFHLHKTPQAQNQPVAPAIAKAEPPAPTPVNLPPSTTTIPTQPTENAQAPSQPVKPPVKRKRPATPPPAPAAATQQAADATSGVSAIGQLSSGNPTDLRRQTEDTISATERSLNSINRPLSSSDQTTADHIREFIKQARAALLSGDVDGAHTLATKAKVLLGELTNP